MPSTRAAIPFSCCFSAITHFPQQMTEAGAYPKKQLPRPMDMTFTSLVKLKKGRTKAMKPYSWSFQVLLPLSPYLLSLQTSRSASSSGSSLSMARMCKQPRDTRNNKSTESYEEQLKPGRRKCTSGEELCCYTSEWHKPTRGHLQLRTNAWNTQ